MNIKLVLVIPNLFVFYFFIIYLKNEIKIILKNWKIQTNKSKSINLVWIFYMLKRFLVYSFELVWLVMNTNPFFKSWKVALCSLCISLFIVCFLTLICIVVLLCCISIWISIVCFSFKIIFEIQIKIKNKITETKRFCLKT